jgi:hypothetical protein
VPSVGAVVDAHKGAVVAECIGDADGSGFRHVACCFIDGQPGDPPCFAGWVDSPADGAAPEGERDDAQAHVLVHADELLGPDLDAGLFEHFAGDAVGWGFVQFEDAARWHPAAVVGALDGQDPAVVAEDDAGAVTSI